MNILILTTHLNKGGVSRYVINLAKGLKKRGHTVYAATSGGEWVSVLHQENILHKYIPIQTKSIGSLKILLSLCKLAPFIKSRRIQVIHSNSRVTQCLGFWLSKLTGIPYVSAFHGYYRASFFRKQFKLCGNKTIAVSRAVKRHLIEDLNISGEKIKVIYNGIEKEEFLTRTKTKADSNFAANDFLIGILGRISREKGHFLAAEAVQILLAEYKNCYLLISGRGKVETALKQFICRQNLENNVKFMDEKAQDFLDILDLLIVPSEKEGFGYAVIEAFAKEVPVVGFNIGGVSEIITHKETGILFYEYNALSLKNAIAEIITNKPLREKIIKNAKEAVSAFTIESMAEETEKVYREAMQ